MNSTADHLIPGVARQLEQTIENGRVRAKGNSPHLWAPEILKFATPAPHRSYRVDASVRKRFARLLAGKDAPPVALGRQNDLATLRPIPAVQTAFAISRKLPVSGRRQVKKRSGYQTLSFGAFESADRRLIG